MKEQPSQPNPEDLFEWGETNNPPAKKIASEIPAEKISEDTFEPECTQCDLGTYCPKHGGKKAYPASMPTFAVVESDASPLTIEDEMSSERLADLELERKRLEDEENRKLTDEEIQEWCAEVNQNVFGKKAS